MNYELKMLGNLKALCKYTDKFLAIFSLVKRERKNERQRQRYTDRRGQRGIDRQTDSDRERKIETHRKRDIIFELTAVAVDGIVSRTD